MSDNTKQLVQQIDTARREKKSLNIIGGNSKTFYGRTPIGEPLHLAQHHGITNYEPTELVITARAGTALEEIENALRKNQQTLPFEPPYFGANATLGGTVACNFSGPRRAYAGAARDFVLGTTIINGKAETLRFGGEVMKNVAGYDVSRLMAGAMGTLGVLLDISLKVLPKPAYDITLVKQMDAVAAITLLNQLAGKPVPLSASCYLENKLYIRLSGARSSVIAAQAQLAGESLDDDAFFWRELREQRLTFFQTPKPLWRLSVPPTTPPLALSGEACIEWGGGLRWLASDEPAQRIREITREALGHAVLFRGGDRSGDVFQPLAPAMMKLHRNLKHAFDPDNIFNPGRMYSDF